MIQIKDFPIRVGSKKNIENFAKSINKGQEILLITREGNKYLTNGKGGYISLNNAMSIKNVEVDDSNKANDRILVYKSDIDKLVYEDKPTSSISDKKNPPDNVTDLKYKINKNQVELSWRNPKNKDFAGVKILRKEGNKPSKNENDGEVIYTSNAEKYIDTINDKTKKYTYSIFPFDNSKPIPNYNIAIANTILVEFDNTPPKDLKLLKATSGHMCNKIKFEENDDEDWLKTVIVRKIDSLPTSIEDGTIVLTNTVKGQYKDGFLDNGLQNGINYFYRFFIYDVNDNINTNIVNSISSQPVASALPEVMGINATYKEDLKLNIEWTNPMQVELKERILYYNINGISLDDKDKKYCDDPKNDITLGNSGIGSGVGAKDSFVIDNLKDGDIVNVKIINHYQVSGNSFYTQGISISKEIKDIFPPQNVTNLVAVSGDKCIYLNWTDSISNDLDRVVILRKTENYALSEQDTGITIIDKYSVEDKDKHRTKSLEDTGLQNNVEYFYSILSYDKIGNMTIDKVTSTPMQLPVYTLIYNKDTKKYKRSGLSEDKTINDLLNESLWKSIKRCVVDDNINIKYYLKDTDSTYKQDNTSAKLDGNDGQVMVEIPKFYYKIENIDTEYSISITDKKLPKYDVFPAFKHGSTEYEKIYISAFEGSFDTNNKLQSIANVKPCINKDIVGYRTSAKARGDSWNILDYNGLQAVFFLYSVAYGTFNVQNNFMGMVNDNHIHNTGETIILGNKSENSDNNDGKHSCSILGIENIFGNTHTVIDGLIATNDKLYKTDNNYDSFKSENETGTYSFVDNYKPIQTGFIGDIQRLDGFKQGFISGNNLGNNQDLSGDLVFGLDTDKGFGYCYLYGRYDSNVQTGLTSLAFISSDNGTTKKEFVIDDKSILKTKDEYLCTVTKSKDLKSEIKEFSSFGYEDDDKKNLILRFNLSNVNARLMAWK